MPGYLLSPRTASAAVPVLFFLAGWALACRELPGGRFAFLLLSLLSGLSAASAVYQLYPKGRSGLAAWLVLLVLLSAGGLKYFWLLLAPDAANSFFPVWVWPVFGRRDLLLPVFAVLSLAIAAFCAGLYFFRGLLRDNGSVPDLVPATGRVFIPGWGALSALGLLAAASLAAVKTFKIGVLGLPPPPLPFRLSGLIFYYHTILLPVLMLSLVHLAGIEGRRKAALAGLVLLFAWAGGDALVRGSRGSLLLAPLLTVFLSLSGGLRIRRNEWLMIAAAVLAALILAPLAVQYRVLRVQGAGLIETFAGLSGGLAASVPALFRTSIFFFFRIPGAEMLFVLLGLGVRPLGAAAPGVLLSPEGLPGHLTKHVIGVDYLMSFSPSFMGSGYMLLGYAGVLLFSVGAAALAVIGWGAIRGLPLRLKPVFSAFFLLVFFFLLTEGLTPIVVKQAFSAAAACAFCEALLRLAERGKAA